MVKYFNKNENNQDDEFAENKSAKLDNALYLVATPIGNLGDMTFRAVETLKNADIILSEDTRIGGKLLSAFGIKNKLIRADEEVAEHAANQALNVIEKGGSVALISDAGTPSISDPGQRVAKVILDAGYEVFALPGASSVLVALVASGFDIKQFAFMGFAPNKQNARKAFFEELKALPLAIAFFETGKRLIDCLEDMLETLGNRKIAVTRELTKLYEEKRRGGVSELLEYYKENGHPKGEIVIILEKNEEKEEITEEDLQEMIKPMLATMSVKDIAKELAAKTGINKKSIYDLALKLK